MPRPEKPSEDGAAKVLEDNERGGAPIDNRQAEVAMDRLMSHARRPAATAARHTDARSLAVPVPRGTMIPNGLPIAVTSTGIPRGVIQHPAASGLS
jgi:hypothetical protein